jgi:predicted 3-demethylubiquinone-9 3-methyltransferase (glyoxalase superfamily)
VLAPVTVTDRSGNFIPGLTPYDFRLLDNGKVHVMTVSFELEGQEFIALNGGPLYTFTPAISFFVDCKTQQEVDELWDKLTAGGGEVECGWLRDKYGLSWQIIPTALLELMQDKDPVKSQRVFKAMLQMTKIDIEGLQRAYRGE